jgi:tripartite-type tricarboxylate transporter receptor subunit TctC
VYFSDHYERRVDMFTPIRNLSKVVLIVILLITALFISKGLSQEHYPNNPITMVVPWSAGLQDIMTRAICKVAEKELGQPIIVENKPGANAAIGTNYVLKSKPDGYTLGTNGAATLAINPHLQKFPFNVLTDVIAISGFCKYNHLLCVRADAPWNTFEDLIAYAKKNPGKFTYAVSGIADPQHICMEQLAMKEGIKWTAIPFKGGGGAVLAALGGNTDAVAMSALETSAHIKAGKLKVLLVLTRSRLPAFPDVPTILEKGYDFHSIAYYVGIYGPRGLPEPIRERLEGVFRRATRDPFYIETASRLQIEVADISGKEFSDYWKSKYHDMGKVIKALGLGEK